MWKNHEKFIAEIYGGRRTKQSGAGIQEKGDVQVVRNNELVECKMRGNTDKPKRSKIVKDFEKIAQEAYEEGMNPMLALRYFDPSSTLADNEGNVDLVVRLARDDAERLENHAN